MNTSSDLPLIHELTPRYAIRCAKVGHFVLFVPQRQLLTLIETGSQSPLELGFAPSRLLELLLRNADAIVPREEILDYAWPGRVVTQNSLNQAISSLRELLGDEQDKKIIQTIPRRGYLFNASFLVAAEELPVHDELVVDVRNQVDESTIFPLTSLSRLKQSVIRRVSTTYLVSAIALLMLGSLVWRVDWVLLWQPGFIAHTAQDKNQRLIYTAPSQARLASLEREVAPLRERLVNLAITPGSLAFNRVNDYYDVVCIDQYHAVEFIFVHKLQLATITDQQLQDCLK